MNTHEILSTQVDLDGLLEVLSRNLYSTPIVVVRELIQNAHDACVRRRSESDWGDASKIRISGNINKKTLSITDNGSGLTRDEVVKYLATIGSGYTRKLRQSEGNVEAIGYFGLGFLTAYVVAKKVEFITTSYQSPDKTSRFTSRGGKQYTLSPDQEGQEIGSTVVLHLQDEFVRLAQCDYLTQLVSRYCCLLPIEVYVNDNPSPANVVPIPWRLGSDVSNLRRQQLSLEFAQLFDGQFEPVTTIPIPYDNKANLRGLIWLQDGSFYSTSDNRVSSVFIRSMHITDDAKDLLPEWAGFVGCVVDSLALTPTASRETVQKDEAFEAARELVKKTLIDALVKIASDRGAVWRRLQSRHNQSLLGACLADPQLFDEMHDVLELPTSAGDMTATAAMRRTVDGKLTISLEQGGGFEQLVARSTGTPLVYGYRFAVMAFCRELKRRYGIGLRTLGGAGDDSLFPVSQVSDQLSTALNANFSRAEAELVISEFSPSSLPAVYVLDQDALLKRRLESDELDRSVGSATLSLARGFTNSLTIEHDAYLYVNMNNSIIANFLSYSAARQTLLAQVILMMTKLLANDSVPVTEQDSTESILRELTTGLEGLAQEKNP